MATYNGHKNWNHWNVSLWINNDEDLYRLAKGLVDCYEKCGGRDEAAKAMLESLVNSGTTKTPDGAPYSVSSIRAAMAGM
jgi:hypothetical protein